MRDGPARTTGRVTDQTRGVPAPAPGHRHPLRVVVVDDDRRELAAIRQTLDLESDRDLVGEAAGVAEARALALAAAPDVALVDVLATGLELVRLLSATPRCLVVAP